MGLYAEAGISIAGGYVIGKGLSLLFKAGGRSFKLFFGRNFNQTSHAFRHLHASGANGVKVMDELSKSVKANYSKIPVGQGKFLKVKVNGVTYKFRAYKFPDGNVNVGRITPE